jgi:phosphatidylglycerol:prolipoprotein diacylglycerol transferase
MVHISFPGIGIDEFTVNKVAFSLGKIEVRWYGIIITTGILLAILYSLFRSKQEGFTTDDLLDMFGNKATRTALDEFGIA